MTTVMDMMCRIGPILAAVVFMQLANAAPSSQGCLGYRDRARSMAWRCIKRTALPATMAGPAGPAHDHVFDDRCRDHIERDE